MADFIRDYVAGIWEPAAAGSVDRAKRLEDCGNYLVFRRILEENPRTVLHWASYCKQWRLCPFCAMLRASRLIRRFAERIASYVLRFNVEPLLVTHTIRTGPDLVERFEHLQACYRKLMERRRKALTGSPRHRSQLTNVVGGVRQVEIKRQSNAHWHVHSHSVFLVRGRLDWEAGIAEWGEMSEDSKRCRFDRLSSVKSLERRELLAEEFGDALGRDLCEVIKYPIKFEPGGHRDVWEAFVLLGLHRRMFSSFGWCKGDDDENADYLEREEIDWGSLKWVELLYRYGAGRYSLVRSGKEAGPDHSQGRVYHGRGNEEAG